MTIVEKLFAEKNKLSDLKAGIIADEWIARPNCDVCAGKGMYEMTFDQWYTEIKIEVEKNGATMMPRPEFNQYAKLFAKKENQPYLQVACDCRSNEQSVMVYTTQNKIANLERACKWIEVALGNDALKKTFEEYKWPDENRKSMMREWIKNQKQNLYIFGNKGKGKTHLLSCLAQHFSEKKIIAAKFTDLMDIGLHEKEGRSKFIDELCLCDMLYIDDVGGKLKQDHITMLETIFDYRFKNKKPWIITSEIDSDLIFNDITNTEKIRCSLKTNALKYSVD